MNIQHIGNVQPIILPTTGYPQYSRLPPLLTSDLNIQALPEMLPRLPYRPITPALVFAVLEERLNTDFPYRTEQVFKDPGKPRAGELNRGL